MKKKKRKLKKKSFFVVFLILVCIGVGAYFYLNPINTSSNLEENKKSNKQDNISKEDKALLISNTNVIENQYEKYDFEKVYLSYRRYMNKNEYDNEIKTSIRLNTIQVMKDKRISKYKIYNSLHLNPGNVNDYLTNGNVKKVSLLISKKIYQYCLSL